MEKSGGKPLDRLMQKTSEPCRESEEKSWKILLIEKTSQPSRKPRRENRKVKVIVW